jgi:hypothetical protein
MPTEDEAKIASVKAQIEPIIGFARIQLEKIPPDEKEARTALQRALRIIDRHQPGPQGIEDIRARIKVISGATRSDVANATIWIADLHRDLGGSAVVPAPK